MTGWLVAHQPKNKTMELTNRDVPRYSVLWGKDTPSIISWCDINIIIVTTSSNKSTLNFLSIENFTTRTFPLVLSASRCTIFPFLYRTYRLNCDLNSCQATNLKDFWSPTFVSSNDVYLTTANSAFRNNYFVSRKASISRSSRSFLIFLAQSLPPFLFFFF